MKKVKLFIPVFLVSFLIGAGGTFAYFDKIKSYLERRKIETELQKEQDAINNIPEEIFSIEEDQTNPNRGLNNPVHEIEAQSIPREQQFLNMLPSVDELPNEKLLAVPFICQNPFQDVEGWKWHEASCEEAAVLQDILYLRNEEMTRQEAHEYILEMLEWQKKPENFGTHKDIYKEDLEKFTEGFFDLDQDEVFFFEDADKNFIKQCVAMGIPVVVPTVAKDLHNPFYRHPGYHMLTVIGYNESKVITNDVGTRRGEKFPYTWDTLMTANKAAQGGVLIIWPMSEDEKNEDL